MTPTEKAALDRWAERIRDARQEWPRVESGDAYARMIFAHKFLEDAIKILEDGLPF